MNTPEARRRYLKTVEAAAYIGFRPSTMATMRKEHRGPVPIRLSANRVAYDVASLDRYMQERATLDDTPEVAAARERGRVGGLRTKARRAEQTAAEQPTAAGRP